MVSFELAAAQWRLSGSLSVHTPRPGEGWGVRTPENGKLKASDDWEQLIEL